MEWRRADSVEAVEGVVVTGGAAVDRLRAELRIRARRRWLVAAAALMVLVLVDLVVLHRWYDIPRIAVGCVGLLVGDRWVWGSERRRVDLLRIKPSVSSTVVGWLYRPRSGGRLEWAEHGKWSFVLGAPGIVVISARARSSDPQAFAWEVIDRVEIEDREARPFVVLVVDGAPVVALRAADSRATVTRAITEAWDEWVADARSSNEEPQSEP